jgi:hypothetical protein
MASMHFTLDTDEIRTLVRAVVSETLAELDWPKGRLALGEMEAAKACGLLDTLCGIYALPARSRVGGSVEKSFIAGTICWQHWEACAQ